MWFNPKPSVTLRCGVPLYFLFWGNWVNIVTDFRYKIWINIKLSVPSVFNKLNLKRSIIQLLLMHY